MNHNDQSTKKSNRREGKAKSVPQDFIYGKVPPQAKELEEAVLGAIMLEKDAFDKAMELLQPECFYLESHQRIYRAMQQLSTRHEPIDIFTVVEQLKIAGELDTAGGPYYVTKLTNAVVSSANLVAHARIVYQKYLQREIIRISSETLTDAYDNRADAFDLLQDLERKISGLAVNQTIKQFKTLGEVAAASVQRIHEAKESGMELTGVPSGLPHLDAITQGWQLTNLIILAARPGVGKSALAGNFAMNAATHQVKPTSVGVFSLEMSAGQWVDRMLSASTHIGLYNLKRGRVDDEEMKKLQTAALVDYPKISIFFDDTPSLDIYKLKSKARILVLRHKVGLLIVDYLQLMSGSRQDYENREQEVARISRELKQLAKELNIPIIALSQLSRKGEAGEPQLGHLRESGAIEQDADDVIFLYPVEEADIALDANLKDSVLMSIAKHRNGIQEKLSIKFVKSIQKLMTDQEYERHTTGSNWKPLQTNLNLQPAQAINPAEDMPF